MILSGDTPTPLQLAALAAAAAPYPGARLSVAAVDGAVALGHGRLLHALYSARPAGAGLFASVLLPAPPASLAPSLPVPAGAPAAAGVQLPVDGSAPAAPAVAASPPVAPTATFQQLVASVVSDLLGSSPSWPPLAPDEPLMSAGINSSLAMALTGRLEERLGVALPPTLVR